MSLQRVANGSTWSFVKTVWALRAPASELSLFPLHTESSKVPGLQPSHSESLTSCVLSQRSTEVWGARDQAELHLAFMGTGTWTHGLHSLWASRDPHGTPALE
jgi:hypothetical protein